MIVHIYDIIITGKDFKRTTRGKEFKRYLSIDFEIINNKIKFKFILKAYFEELKIGNSFNPMPTVVTLRTIQKNEKDLSILPITGKIRYCADKNRPDILYIINTIS